MNALAPMPAADARLPVAYEAAKVALANCASIDECKDWADKAEALASYAKQADDDTLRKHADRIQARAIRRCGELLKQFDGRGGDRSKSDGAVISAPTQRQAAEGAGISERQRVTAVRVANVPADTFEQHVESEAPPTVTKLADMGRKPRQVVDLAGRDPADFNKSMHFRGMLRDYARELSGCDLSDILPRLNDAERNEVRIVIGRIDAAHDAIITRI